jgi:uncharacterized phiE125 gp8 family phage protein
MITELATNGAPKREPVELTDLEMHLRLDIDYPTEQPLLESYISAARKLIEQITGLALMQQTWLYYMENWPRGDFFKLPYPPLISVTSVKYRDSDYVEREQAAGERRVLTKVKPGRVALDYGEVWPSDTLIDNAEAIYTEFICGYGTARTDVPEPIRVAIMQLVGHLYENREKTSVQQLMDVPYTVFNLVESYRVSRFGL